MSSLPLNQNTTSTFTTENINDNLMSSILNFSFKTLLQQQNQQIFLQNLTAQQFSPNFTSVVSNNNNNINNINNENSNYNWNNNLIGEVQSQIQIIAKKQQKQQLTESQIFLLGNLLLNYTKNKNNQTN